MSRHSCQSEAMRNYGMYVPCLFCCCVFFLGGIVQSANSCAVGYYGDTCSDTCPAMCRDGCTRNDGYCTRCQVGWYGNRCDQQCSSNCLLYPSSSGGRCDIYSGYCTDGCVVGYYGDTCSDICPAMCRDGCTRNDGYCTRCQVRWYGYRCDQQCSPNCLLYPSSSGGSCYIDGYCTDGCQDGWYGGKCQQACSSNCAPLRSPSSGRICHRDYGYCNNGCQDGWYGNSCEQECSSNCAPSRSPSSGRRCDGNYGHCLEGCSEGWHGYFCNISCKAGCSGPCVQLTGSCNNCKKNFEMPKCIKCQSGWEGADCNLKTCSANCARNRNYDVCDRNNGMCIHGCQDGWYGNSCEQACSSNCLPYPFTSSSRKCHRVSGNCTHGCVVGYYGDTCSDTCPAKCRDECRRNDGYCTLCQVDWYGNSCEQACSSNCLPHHSTPIGIWCKRDSGYCTDGCVVGYYGDTCSYPCPAMCRDGCRSNDGYCTRCVDGWYGNTCNMLCRGSCFGGCNRTTGNCTTCKGNFTMPECTGCIDGWYGDSCNMTCRGSCFGGCNRTTGECSSCKGNFTMPECTECTPGFYGMNCTEVCGRCINDETCSPVNGLCANGCMEGFSGNNCKMPIASVTQSAIAGIVGGVIAGLAVIIAVLIIVIMYGRRRRQMTNESTEEKSGNGEPFYNNILTQEMHPGSDTTPLHVYGNITSSSSHGLQPRKMPRKNISVTNDTYSPSDDKCNAGVDIHKYENVGAVASAGQNLALKQSHDARVSLSGAKDIKTDAEDDVFEESYDDIYNSEDIYSAYKPDKPSPQLDALQRSLLASLASGELSTQFELLPKGMISSHKEGVKPANIKKNRFKALCAYDHSRVILHRPAGDPDTDYINANYIKGYKKDKAYIAAQGPRSSTVNDMWWTIWQEGITQIVMLTNLTEDGKNKCDEYWPKAGTTCTYGHVEITNVDEEQRADFIKRSFSIKEKGTTAKRQLEQYHYVAWPDHGVPPATSLVNFWRYIKAQADPKAPPFVHCSAGVGRTGTYIALDIAMDIAVDKGDVDVHNIVNNLRKDRCIMVQAEAQYKFLHEVILEAYTSHKTRLTFKRFKELFPEEINIHKNNKIIDNEYKMLQQMGKFHPKSIHDVSSSKANINKNRNVNALPDDNHLAYLAAEGSGRNTYINATYLSSFKQRKGVILTQLPLPDTLEDFWRLVDCKEINTIVSLGSNNDVTSIKNFCQYWPKTVNESLTLGPYVINLMASSSIGTNLTSYSLSILTEKKTREVRLLHYRNWAGEVPDNTGEIIHLVDTLSTSRVQTDTCPLLFQCIDGASRSGLFSLSCDIVNRAVCDREIDIFQSARQVQSVRPEAVNKEAQYRYCYKLAQDYQRHMEVYQNT